jgi:hypothetical protein
MQRLVAIFEQGGRDLEQLVAIFNAYLFVEKSGLKYVWESLKLNKI